MCCRLAVCICSPFKGFSRVQGSVIFLAFLSAEPWPQAAGGICSPSTNSFLLPEEVHGTAPVVQWGRAGVLPVLLTHAPGSAACPGHLHVGVGWWGRGSPSVVGLDNGVTVIHPWWGWVVGSWCSIHIGTGWWGRGSPSVVGLDDGIVVLHP